MQERGEEARQDCLAGSVGVMSGQGAGRLMFTMMLSRIVSSAIEGRRSLRKPVSCSEG